MSSSTDPSGRVVAEAMIRSPKTLPANAAVTDVRALLSDEHMHIALLVSGDRLVGTVSRVDLDASSDPLDPAAEAVTVSTLNGRTVAPGTPLELAGSIMVATSQRRLAVVDPGGRLLGLLCLKRTGDGFCSNLDVASRAADAVRSSGVPTTTE